MDMRYQVPRYGGKMKRLATLIALLLMLSSIEVRAVQPELQKAHATAYILRGKTSSGAETRNGICASGNPEWQGKTIIAYQRLQDGSVGRMLFMAECLDSGCSPYVIDYWEEDIQEAQRFMDMVYEDGCQGKIYIQVLDAEG